MSALHLAKGSKYPELQNGILRVYNMRFCPYAERALLVLCAKNIKHEVVNINLKFKPDWFLQKNPFGKVPVLEKDGKLMFESIAICDYLDEANPTPSLYPEDLWTKAIDKSLIEILNEKFATPLIRSFYKLNNLTLLEAAFEDVRKGLQLFEEELKKRGSKFLNGNIPGMVDYAFWPWFERIPVITAFTGEELSILSEETFPCTAKYMRDLSEDNVVKAIQIPTDQHVEFFKGFLSREPNYDIGVTEDSKL